MAYVGNLYQYYKILGCNKESSYEELKKAYKKMALLHHPDKNQKDNNNGNSNVNNDKFLEIEEAWRILCDDQLRSKYDAECRQAELELGNILIYDKVNIRQMTEEDNEFLSYPCRCGNNYLISKEEFAEYADEVVYIQCQECTFSIVVEK